jgi:glycosyltransferase involved in cell wall biosynthesis
MRVALVHDWLTGMRGGEKVLDAICELFPDAPLYTLVHVPGTVSARIEARQIVTSLAQRLPSPRRFYRHYLPIYPLAVELFDLDRFDLVISSSHCAVKSVVTPSRAVHVCYCHSPMRYAWDQFDSYFGADQVGVAASWILRRVLRQLARWDAATAGRVDRFLANSQYVAGRIRRYYNRGSTIVYPPVDTDFYSLQRQPSSPSFLIVSALVPYKRLDIAIESCRRVGVPLKIVGVGPELSRLQAIAGPDVEFLGSESDDRIRELYRQSSATLLPGVEDFGIVPVEAQACGCPVVARDLGGARETVLDGVTGVLVKESSTEAFADGLARVLQTPFDPEKVRDNALRFSRQQFLSTFKAAIEGALAERGSQGRTVQDDDPDAASQARVARAAGPEEAASQARLTQSVDPDAASQGPLTQSDDPDAASQARLTQSVDPEAASQAPLVQKADRENEQ